MIAVLMTLLSGAAPASWTAIAEFEPQESVWLSARPAENGEPALDVVAQMISALAPHVVLHVAVPDDATRERLTAMLRVDQARISYWTARSSPTRWYRDVGPAFVRKSGGSVAAIDFDFNCYGECPRGSDGARGKEALDREMAALAGIPVIERTTLVSEGGDREVNGRGTLMAIEETELQRNPGMTRDAIERELLRLLGQRKLIWLKRGIAEDDKAERGPLRDDVYPIGCGHIDEVARFVAPDTIALAEVTAEERDRDPILRDSFDRLEENLRILRAATDQDGRPFRIVRMPIADPILVPHAVTASSARYFHGSHEGEPIRILISASYMNFFISNGVVLEAAYFAPGRPESTRRKDELARATLARLFPGREVVPIHAEPLNHGGGGMHCATLQQPTRR